MCAVIEDEAGGRVNGDGAGIGCWVGGLTVMSSMRVARSLRDVFCCGYTLHAIEVFQTFGAELHLKTSWQGGLWRAINEMDKQ